jgi:hypothetical protein
LRPNIARAEYRNCTAQQQCKNRKFLHTASDESA